MRILRMFYPHSPFTFKRVKFFFWFIVNCLMPALYVWLCDVKPKLIYLVDMTKTVSFLCINICIRFVLAYWLCKYYIHVVCSTVPLCVWRINLDTPEEGKTISMDNADDRWWEQVDLTKLILASNAIDRLSNDIQLLPALVVLDVLIIFVCLW